MHKKVPILIRNGKPVCESQIIMQYIDDVYGGTGASLLPGNPYERAMARFWAAFIDDKVSSPTSSIPAFPICIHQFSSSIYADRRVCILQLLASWVQASRGKTMEEKMERLKPTFAAIETLEAAFGECSKGKPFFGGDSVGYLDVMLGGLVAWVRASKARHGLELFDASKSPLLNAWVECFSALDETRAVLPDIDRLVEYAKMREAQAAAAN